MAETETDDGATVSMDQTPDDISAAPAAAPAAATAAVDLLELPTPCPAWELKPPHHVLCRSFANAQEAAGTYRVPPQSLKDLQSNALVGYEAKENNICVATILPCIVEQSPVLGACAGPRQPFARYTTSIATLSLLHDLRALFGIVWYSEYKSGPVADVTKKDAIAEQMRLYRASLEQLGADFDRNYPAGGSDSPEAFSTFLEQYTLTYIHLQERCIIRMLWIVSGRNPAELVGPALGRFLTRAIVYRVDAKTLLPPIAVAQARQDAIYFFATKQQILHAGAESASEQQQKTFFPPESEQHKRVSPAVGLVPLETLKEYEHYLTTKRRLLWL